jgi:hypothetical protein
MVTIQAGKLKAEGNERGFGQTHNMRQKSTPQGSAFSFPLMLLFTKK